MTLRSRTLFGSSVLFIGLFTRAASAQTPAPPPTSVAPPAVPATATPAAATPAPQPAAPPPAAQNVAPTAPPAASTPPAPLGPPPPAPQKTSIVELSSLRLMLEKGIISKAEYDSALTDIQASAGTQAPDAPSLVVGKWSTTLYGFAETDLINDSTQSFNDIAGNGLVARPNGVPDIPVADQNTYPGNHGRTQMSVRNSRLGLQLRAPETHGVRASGLIETDFEGYLPTPSASSGPSQSQFFSSPSIRIRHAYLKVETPIVDLLVGQYWDLFGWQNVYHPNSVQIQGLVGELYSRDAQIRLSHAFKTKPIGIEVAVAMRRPPSSDSQYPEGQGGVRFSFPWWRGVTTTGATATSVQSASVAVTGDVRQFTLPQFSQFPTQSVSLTTQAIAVDAFIPVIPQRTMTSGNALSLTGEFVTGGGISDLYTSLSNGLTFPVLVNTSTSETTAGNVYPQDVDNGMVIYDLNGNLHAIQLLTFVVGAQYYLPGVGGRVWVSGNFARTQSSNINQFTRDPVADPLNPTVVQYASNATVTSSENFADANVFWDVVPGARLGFEYANFNDQYVDGVHAINNRFQFSGFFIF